MKCYFRSFDVGIGDCNIIRLVKENESQYVIMVDCGKYTKPLKEYLINTLKNKIDLLIATHIDGDHIQGIATMLEEHKDLIIKNIWFNCYRRKENTEYIKLNEQQEIILNHIKNIFPVEFDAINYKEISANQGITLAQRILCNIELKNVWKKEYITNETEDFKIPGDFGKIKFLAPKQDALQAIENKFKNAFNKYFMQIWNESIENGEELQELLIRLVDSYEKKFIGKPISAKTNIVYDATYVRNQAKEEDADNSDTNYSSIAFMLECGEHKIAMLGDAFASTLEETIDDKYKEINKPIICDAIKISHHGSNGNSSKALFERINSNLYFIPGGKGEKYPTWGTLGRISETNKEEQEKKIVFSHKCSMTEKIHGMEEDQKKILNVKTIISEEEYELFEW